MNMPKRLLVEYEDGSSKTIPFSDIDKQTQHGLAKFGICEPPGMIDTSKQYLLFKWDDTWQEVVGLDGEAGELIRYYVVERIENSGRLAVEVGQGYPEVFIVGRKPRELTNLLIIDRNGRIKSYGVESEVQRREGFLDDGGKYEYVKFDRKDPQYPHESSEDPVHLTEIKNLVKRALDKKGLRPEQLLAMAEPVRIESYKELATGLGVRARDRQEDVYGFVELIVGLLGA